MFGETGGGKRRDHVEDRQIDPFIPWSKSSFRMLREPGSDDQRYWLSTGALEVLSFNHEMALIIHARKKEHHPFGVLHLSFQDADKSL